MQDSNALEPALQAGVLDHYNHREDDDYYSQSAALFRLFDPEQKERLFSNIARHIDGVPKDIVERALEHFVKIDLAYGAGVRAAVAKRARSPAACSSPRIARDIVLIAVRSVVRDTVANHRSSKRAGGKYRFTSGRI
ncbi:TPA: catalase [Burkholderia multivorans]|uniref:Catalase n=1 Tax=Burkholderia multivorans CGD2 TaxID=513052 RepID=B9BNT8_9BURK|nr:catalase [Burkholderia multivorans CGD2]EEE13626.1 catalase [Burkholderia multivorans CGD2M]KUY59286.1 catalase [Burkholderia sp. RF2-non_BP3]PRH32891.1 catalase [Burkholderia multivorans]HEM7843602.1 catalase [Burkholderia multivorans]